jgi:hypothetical protein
MKIEEEEVERFVNDAGPCLSVAKGSFYWTVAAEAQLGRKTDVADVQIRSVLGITL